MSFYLKLRDYSYRSRFIFFEFLEEIPMGGTFMQAGKWKYAQEFDNKEEAEEFKRDFDDSDSYIVVNVLHESS